MMMMMVMMMTMTLFACLVLLKGMIPTLAHCIFFVNHRMKQYHHLPPTVQPPPVHDVQQFVTGGVTSWMI